VRRPQRVVRVWGPWGTLAPSCAGKNLRTGFGILGRPSTSRFWEDSRVVLFSLLSSIFIFQGSESSRALGVEIRWRGQISARLGVRARARVCVCVRARGFPTAAGVSEAGLAQRDVF
jgi:hypothetical protein